MIINILGDLNLVKLNFVSHSNFNIEKLITKKFNEKYDSIINLVGYIDNKSFGLRS